MKKTLAVILALVMVLAMAACGTKSSSSSETAQGITLTEQQQSQARYALGLLINRVELVEDVTQGGQAPATGFYPNGLSDGKNADVRAASGYGSWYGGTNTPSAENAAYTEDQVEACKILMDLGYAYTGTIEGGDIKFTNVPAIDFAFNNSGANALIIQYIQETWNTFGITATINTEAWATLQTKLKNGDAEAARMGWIADFNDCVNFLEIFISDSGNNYPRLGRDIGDYTKATDTTKDAGTGAYWGTDGNQTWADAYDALVDKIKSETDMDKRAEMCAEAEKILMSTGGVAPMYFYTNPYMLKPAVTDLIMLTTGDVIWNYAKYSGGDTVSVYYGGGTPLSIDPALNSSSSGSNIIKLAFTGLMGFQWVDGEAKLMPELAESYTISEDSKTYVFTLREGLKWSDGSDLKASEIVASWNRAGSEELGADYGFLFDYIERNADKTLNVVADDDARTLTVQLVNPTAYFLDLCAFPTFYPVKTELADNEGTWATDPAKYIGAGAFTMTAYKVDDVITFEKNPYYWNAENVSLNGVNCYLSEDNVAILTAYENDTAQFINSIDPTEYNRLYSTYPGELVMGPYMGTWYVLFNVYKDMSPVTK